MSGDDPFAIDGDNPYAAPASEVRDIAPPRVRRLRLASRGARLAAHILDSVFHVLTGVAGILIGMSVGDEAVAIALAVLFVLGSCIYQVMLLVQNSWTLGKKVVSIKIVKPDGTEIAVGRILVLRIIVSRALSWILWPVYGLLDALFIFRGDRRCIHDLLAGTTVVDA